MLIYTTQIKDAHRSFRVLLALKAHSTRFKGETLIAEYVR